MSSPNSSKQMRPAQLQPEAKRPVTTRLVTTLSARRGLVGLCALIVVAATAIRVWVASAGWFYWDDLLLHGLGAAHRFPGPELLLTDHDGHLMPGGMVLAWLAAHAAPLDFRLPLLQIAILHLLAGAALVRMLWVLLRGRAVLLAPLILVLVIPLGLPAATWWAAALNALPLTAAMAWAVASTVRLAETGRRRHTVGAVLATVVGLLFVEKAVLVPVVAAAVLVGWWWTSTRGDNDDVHRPNLGPVWRTTRWMWAAQVAVLAVWAVVFALAVGQIGAPVGFGGVEGSGGDAGASRGPGPSLWGLVDATYRFAVGPTLAGGPWQWERWHPGPPMADPSTLAVFAGALLCALVLAWSLATRRRTGLVWAVVALYPLVAVALIMVGRAGPDTAAEIVQTLRYHADFAVVLAAALALALAAPLRRAVPAMPEHGTAALTAETKTSPERYLPAKYERWAIAGLVAVVALSSSISTATYRAVWAEQPSRDYLLPLLAALRDREAPMMDTEVPPEVLLPVTFPANRLSSVLAGVDGIPAIGEWTTEPVVVDATGRLHPADVVPGRTIPQGPEPGCGHRIAPGGSRIALDGPLIGRVWVLQLNQFADTDGVVAVRLDEGSEVDVPVSAGLSTVYVRVEGGGTGVTVTPREGVSDLCIGSGPVGVLVPR